MRRFSNSRKIRPHGGLLQKTSNASCLENCRSPLLRAKKGDAHAALFKFQKKFARMAGSYMADFVGIWYQFTPSLSVFMVISPLSTR